ncbi:MAG: hypothetical protein SGJ27_27730 [Candidatus Melainabacteria bacterium]|nr:hypothetical protein [Candidatus Melainabacteria bacterium]
MRDVDKIFELAKKHPFYAERYRDASNFADAPTTDKAHLYKVINQALDEDPTFREGVYLSPTGGSTPDRLLYFPTDIEDNQLQRKMLSPYLNEAKIFSPQTILLNLFGSNMMYRALEIFNDFAERGRATVLPAGSQCEDGLAAEVATRFAANSLIGNPSRILQFARHVESQAIPLKIEHLIFGGETLQEYKADYLKDVLGIKRISAIYGSAESGIWGYQPDALELNCYFYPAEIMHIEILEPDDDGFGRMVLTNLVRTRNPLCRYDCGDIGRITETEHRGQQRNMLEFKGRAENSFFIGSEYFSINDFREPLENLLEFQIQISFDESQKRDRIKFSLVAPNPEFIDANKETIKKQIRHIVQSLDSWFTTEIEFVEISELQRSKTSQKVIKIIDQRS